MPSQAAIARFVKALAVTVILGICLIVPYVGPFVMPFLVLPFAYLMAGWGVRYAIPLVVVGSAFVFVVAGWRLTATFALTLVLLGWVLGVGIRRAWSFKRTLLLTAAAAAVCFVGWGLIAWTGLGLSTGGWQEFVDEAVNSLTTLYSEAGVSATVTSEAVAMLRDMLGWLPYVLPGLVVAGALGLAGCSMGLAYAIFPRLRQRVDVGFSITTFRMHWSTAYVSIVGLALLVAAPWTGSVEQTVRYVGLDVLMISQTLFFFQGLAVVHWFGRTRQLGHGARNMLYALTIVGQAVVQAAGILGLIDTWLDCRRRFALGKPGAGPAR